MRLLSRYYGTFGQIDVIERKTDGTRLYIEGEFLQSQATRTGDRPFQYVRLMDGILRPASKILLLGCGGGTLATALARQGKRVTVIDRNPLSFAVARYYFGMPEAIRCVTADFRQFLAENYDHFDGIGIDVTGPGFSVSDSFDVETCSLVRASLSDGGRITMNVSTTSDLDPLPDQISTRLAGDNLRVWIFDHPGQQERNAIVACRPESNFLARKMLGQGLDSDDEPWSCRRPRSQFAVRRLASQSGLVLGAAADKDAFPSNPRRTLAAIER